MGLTSAWVVYDPHMTLCRELHGLKIPQVFPLVSLFSSPSPQTLRGLLPVSIVLPFPDFRSFYFCLRGEFVLFCFAFRDRALLSSTGWPLSLPTSASLRVKSAPWSREAGCRFWLYWARVPFLAPPLNWGRWSCLAFSICFSSGQLFSPGDRGVSQRSSVHERLQPPKRHPAPRYLREVPERGWEVFTWVGDARASRARLGGVCLRAGVGMPERGWGGGGGGECYLGEGRRQSEAGSGLP